ncbi:MAG: hypothetical protein AAGJ93_00015 [Bacteroidota bacterium]
MISEEQFEEIAKLIHSDTSPVGIDAKKTHVLILQKLLQIEADIKELKAQIGRGEE